MPHVFIYVLWCLESIQGYAGCNDIVLFTCVAVKVTLIQQTAADVGRLRKKTVTPPPPSSFIPSVNAWVKFRIEQELLAVLTCIHTLTVFPTISATQSCWNAVTH